VFRSVGEAREDQCGGTGVMSKFTERCFHAKSSYYVNRYTVKCIKFVLRNCLSDLIK
jgi:hypothetical protein